MKDTKETGMRRSPWPIGVLLAAVLAACAQNPVEPAASTATVEAHVARARALAGDDLAMLVPLCQPQPAERAAPSERMDDQLRALIAKPAPPPMQVFDNL